MTLSAYHTTVDERNEAREVFKMIFSQPKNIVRVLVDTLECPEKAKEPKKSKDRKTQAQRSILELDFSDPTELSGAVSKFIFRAFDALNFMDNEKFAQIDEQGRQTVSQEKVCRRLCLALNDDPVIRKTLFCAVHDILSDVQDYGPLWRAYTDAPALMLAIERLYFENTINQKQENAACSVA